MNAQPAESDVQGLVELIDQLERLLDESELSEIEVEAGSTALVVKKPNAFASAVQPPIGQGVQPAVAAGLGESGTGSAADAPPANAVLAPLTGLFYSSPSPGAQAYTSVGATITVGQVIGLIEAMKLFNEIKSDRGGRVVRIYPQDGDLVKAKQPLIEVEA